MLEAAPLGTVPLQAARPEIVDAVMVVQTVPRPVVRAGPQRLVPVAARVELRQALLQVVEQR